MPILQPASEPAYLKAGVLGFAKSGKTHTAFGLAVGTRRHFDLAGPIAVFDTEDGAGHHKTRVEAETGQPLLVVKSRSLVDLMTTVDECIALGVSVLIVDSITHVWREVVDSYMTELRAAARKKGWREPDKTEFQDWSRIKMRWASWPDRYLTSPLHIVVCGRAGYEYDFQEDDRGKKELIKTGVKMKAEAEFGFEPSLLFEMERVQLPGKLGELINRATVIGDRFDILNGKTCDFPTFDFFRPYVERLKPAQHAPVDTAHKTSFGLDENRGDEWKRERDRREVLAEKIAAAFQLANLGGQSAEDKKNKAALLKKYWGTTSWKEISERTPSAAMAAALRKFEADHGLMADDDDVPTDFRATEPEPPAAE